MMEQTFKDGTFSELVKDVELGINGGAISIPIGMKKLGKYADIRRKIMTLLFSSTGAGKSSLADSAFILNPYDWLYSGLNVKKMKMKTILFSMERAKKYRIGKWTIRKIFNQEGIKIPLPKLLGWWEEKLTFNEHDLFLSCEDYINTLLEDIYIYEGPRSGADMFRICKTHFEANGKYEKISEYKEVYIQNDESVIWNIVIDHGNLTKTTKLQPNKKAAIDNASEIMQGFRDKESAHIIWVSQVNRDASNPLRQKTMDMELNLDDVKSSGDVGDACDLAISLFDPIKYKQDSKTGYNPNDFIDREDGSKYFRSLTLCKSSYGADDVRIPLAFNGFCGDFKELIKRTSLNETEYRGLITDVLNGNYFLK